MCEERFPHSPDEAFEDSLLCITGDVRGISLREGWAERRVVSGIGLNTAGGHQVVETTYQEHHFRLLVQAINRDRVVALGRGDFRDELDPTHGKIIWLEGAEDLGPVICAVHPSLLLDGELWFRSHTGVYQRGRTWILWKWTMPKRTFVIIGNMSYEFSHDLPEDIVVRNRP